MPSSKWMPSVSPLGGKKPRTSILKAAVRIKTCASPVQPRRSSLCGQSGKKPRAVSVKLTICLCNVSAIPVGEEIQEALANGLLISPSVIPGVDERELLQFPAQKHHQFRAPNHVNRLENTGCVSQSPFSDVRTGLGPAAAAGTTTGNRAKIFKIRQLAQQNPPVWGDQRERISADFTSIRFPSSVRIHVTASPRITIVPLMVFPFFKRIGLPG